MQKFVSVVDAASVKAELFPPFAQLAKDDQDSVRLLTGAVFGWLLADWKQ